MSYEKKYLKYKNKYLDLLNITQVGGSYKVETRNGTATRIYYYNYNTEFKVGDIVVVNFEGVQRHAIILEPNSKDPINYNKPENKNKINVQFLDGDKANMKELEYIKIQNVIPAVSQVSKHAQPLTQPLQSIQSTQLVQLAPPASSNATALIEPANIKLVAISAESPATTLSQSNQSAQPDATPSALHEPPAPKTSAVEEPTIKTNAVTTAAEQPVATQEHASSPQSSPLTHLPPYTTAYENKTSRGMIDWQQHDPSTNKLSHLSSSSLYDLSPRSSTSTPRSNSFSRPESTYISFRPKGKDLEVINEPPSISKLRIIYEKELEAHKNQMDGITVISQAYNLIKR